MTEWSNDLRITFMELYQMESIIWNPKHPYHKEKNKLNDAWDRISRGLNIPIQELKGKKISLMATFRGHLRRKKASIKSGAGVHDIYKPIWFLYEFMESFLGDINECTPTINTEKQGNDSQAVEIEESSVQEKSPTPQSPIASTSKQTFPPQHPRQRKSSEYLINEASKQMKETFNTLNNVLKNRRTEEDECDLYCKLLAKKLRGLPEKERALFMYEIDGMFINRLRNLSTPSPNFYIPQRPTSSQSFSSESLHNNEMTIRPNSSCTFYSEPPNKIVSYSDPIYTPRQQNTARMPSPKPTIIAPNHTISLQTSNPPVLLIPEPNHDPDDNSQSITILSDQLIFSPARDYIKKLEYSEE